MNETTAASVTPVAGSTRKFRILYADDMAELRQLAKLSLGRDGHAIECVADGQVALERLVAAPDAFDLLITDHHMPQLNGLELVRRVRTLPFRGKIVIFCSELSPDVHQAYRDLRVDGMLFKPVMPSDLRSLLQRL